MATSPEARSKGELWSGLAYEGSIPDGLRKQGIDEGTKLVYLTRKWNTFTWLITNHFKGRKTTVSDRMYRSYEINEPDRFYTITVASGAGTDAGVERVIGVSNDQGAQIKPNTIIFVKGLFAVPTGQPLVAGQVTPTTGGALGTNIGPDLRWKTGTNVTNVLFSRTKGPNPNGVYFVDEEQLRVVSVGDPDSLGSGNTRIVVDRCYMGPSATDEGGRRIDSAIINTAIAADIGLGQASRLRVGDIILSGAPAYKEGTNYPDGFYKNPLSDINFTQLFKYAIGETKEASIPKSWLKERPLDIARWMALIQMNLHRERQYLCGRKTMERDREGAETYVVGGVREFIPKDKDHYLIYPNATISYPSLLDMSKPLLQLCNSGTMWGVTGPSLDIAMKKSFWNDHLFYNKEESKSFEIQVNTLVLAGININLIVSQVFEEQGYGNELMLLDMAQGDTFEPVTNEGWDYITEKDIAEKGSNLKKEGIQGMFGLRRRRREHHAIMDFSNAVTI